MQYEDKVMAEWMIPKMSKKDKNSKKYICQCNKCTSNFYGDKRDYVCSECEEVQSELKLCTCLLCSAKFFDVKDVTMCPMCEETPFG